MTALATIEKPNYSQPDPGEFGVMKETATMLVTTGFLPASIKTPEQAMAIILTGRELGIGTMAALNTINVIQGKPTVSPQLMLALIERSGQLENIEITADAASGIQCVMKRRGRSAHSEYFGDAEAKAMGLDGKDNYKKQKQTMYRWRAVAACARVVFPDVILGLYTHEEMGANTDTDGEMVELPKTNIRQIANAYPAHPNSPANPNNAQAPRQIEAAQEGTFSVAEICKELKAAGDDIVWNKQNLRDYAEQLFESDLPSLESLTDEQKQFLAEDLAERLKQIKNNQ